MIRNIVGTGISNKGEQVCLDAYKGIKPHFWYHEHHYLEKYGDPTRPG